MFRLVEIFLTGKSLTCRCAIVFRRDAHVFSFPNKKSIQTLSAAEMYLERKLLISEMCMVSLMAVSLLRTWTRPLSSVFSLITTVKSTPISSYLKCINTETHISLQQINTVKETAFAYITTLNCTLLCVQLLHWCWQGFEIPRPRRDLSLHKLLQQPFTNLHNN